jgi:hypothetical protein
MIKVFSNEWFKHNQRTLLFLLNNPLLYKVREELGIFRPEKISKLTGNAIHYQLDKEYIETEIHIKNVYANLLLKNYENIWSSLHNIDLFFKLIKLGKINFGFDTFTGYPDPSVESTSVDGYAGRAGQNETWADIRGGAGTTSNDSSGAGGLVIGIKSTTTDNQYEYIYRVAILFDTSSIIAGATKTSGSVRKTAGSTNSTSSWGAGLVARLHLCSSNPASNTAIASGDFTTFGTTSFADYWTYSYSMAATAKDLNADGLNAVTLGGITKYGLRWQNDLNGTEPTWASAKTIRWQLHGAENTGTDDDPMLTVVYSLGKPRVECN